MSLRDTITKKTSRPASSEKNPQYYNKLRKQFMAEMVGHEESTVRLAAVTSECISVKMLTERLEGEKDPEVTKAILMNPVTPKTAIIKFIKSNPLAGDFDDDEELIAYFEELSLEE